MKHNHIEDKVLESLKQSMFAKLGYTEEPEHEEENETTCSIAPWISVNDRLPEHCEIVLIPYQNSLGFIMAQFMEHGLTCPERKNFFCHTTDWGFDDCRIYSNVKAWLPLPKPKDFLIPKNGYCEF